MSHKMVPGCRQQTQQHRRHARAVSLTAAASSPSCHVSLSLSSLVAEISARQQAGQE